MVSERLRDHARSGPSRLPPRFEKLVDPDGVLDPHERSIRADRARRAYMLTLAARSAAARKQKGQTRRIKDPRLAEEDTDATGMHPPPD